MKYNYVIIDDNDIDRLTLNILLKDISFLENKATFSSPFDGLSYFKENQTDILFLDVEMPGMNGIELLKQVETPAKCVIFTTGCSKYALESYELKVFDYLVKPLEEKRVHNCIERIKNHIDILKKAELYDKTNRRKTFVLKTGTSYVTIDSSEILYLEGLKDYTKIKMKNNKVITIHGNLGSIVANENFIHFIRIHKSYAVDIRAIDLVKSNQIQLASGVSLPLGSRYKKQLLEQLNKNIFQDN